MLLPHTQLVFDAIHPYRAYGHLNVLNDYLLETSEKNAYTRLYGRFLGSEHILGGMGYDKAIVSVNADNDGVVSDVRDLADELDEEGKFRVEVVDESFNTQGSGVDGSKILTVEVDEYVGELELFTAKVRETVSGADIEDVSVERGMSEIPEAVQSREEGAFEG